MSKSLKITLGVLSLGLIAALVAAGFIVRGVLAQAPTPTPSAPGQANSQMSQYQELFWQNLAGLLKTDEATLKQDVITAINNTVDQIVKDGKLTPTQGNQIKQDASQDITSGRGFLPFLGGKRGGFGFGHRGMMGAGVAEFAKALGMNEQDVVTELQAGKSINQIATEHQKDPAQVKQTVLADLKTQLDGDVTSGKLTQAQADTIYQNYSSNIDNVMNAAGGQGFFKFHNGWEGPWGGQNPNNQNAPSTPSTNGSNWNGFYGDFYKQ